MIHSITKKRSFAIGMIFVTTLFQASASAFIKYGMLLMKNNPADKIYILLFILAMSCYGIGFPLYTWCLSRLNLSIAQPVISGSMFMYTLLISIFIFKESFAMIKIFGFASIIGGIVLVVL